MFFDPLYFIFLAPGFLLALYAQMRVKSAFGKASQIAASSRMTGAETARMILDSHDIGNVRVEMTAGALSDHYDPRHKVLRLSEPVYHGHSVAAAGIAAHEAGHAIQDKVHYGPLRLRNGIVPMASIGSKMSMFMFIIGIVMSSNAIGQGLMIGAIVLFSAVVLFQLVNLPVEFDASRRAKDLLRSSNMVTAGAEAKAMNSVLNAAALTYVAATLTAVMTLVYLVMRSGLAGGRN